MIEVVLPAATSLQRGRGEGKGGRVRKGETGRVVEVVLPSRHLAAGKGAGERGRGRVRMGKGWLRSYRPAANSLQAKGKGKERQGEDGGGQGADMRATGRQAGRHVHK